jgi:uncharacterized lipoprotein YmbA
MISEEDNFKFNYNSFFSACSSKELYTIGDISSIKSNGKSSKEFIAIDKVELPIYFMDSPIYKKDTPYHLVEIDSANWIHAMDKHLTNVLVSYLQKSMDNPNIYKYPWSTVTQMDKRVSLTISKFIAYKDKIYIDANYQILDKNKKTDLNNIFNANVNIQGESVEEIVEAMEKAYFKLAKDIKDKI